MSTELIASKVFLACNVIGKPVAKDGRTLNCGTDLKRFTASLVEAVGSLTKKQRAELISRLRA